MKTIILLLTFALLPLVTFAESTAIKLRYESLDFENSKKKDDGSRYALEANYKVDNNFFQAAFERSLIDTFTPPTPHNLQVNKYIFKYTRKLDEKQSFNTSFLAINDTLMKETDEGRIYGFGYRYGALGITQYISDYTNFNVYQTDIMYTFKHAWDSMKMDATIIGKYIYLEDRESNAFSQNAQQSYFTPGIKAHLHFDGFHIGAGAFFGKRIFAVMNNGMNVQHHAMEFEETYMAGIGKHFEVFELHLKYIYQKATEIPIDNKDVEVSNVICEVTYRF